MASEARLSIEQQRQCCPAAVAPECAAFVACPDSVVADGADCSALPAHSSNSVGMPHLTDRAHRAKVASLTSGSAPRPFLRQFVGPARLFPTSCSARKSRLA